MIKLKIDNKEFEVPEGLTIREVANDAGVEIATLCHNIICRIILHVWCAWSEIKDQGITCLPVQL